MFAAAEKYDISTLKEMSEIHNKNMSNGFVIEALQTSKALNCSLVTKLCLDYVATKKRADIKEIRGIKELDRELLVEVIAYLCEKLNG